MKEIPALAGPETAVSPGEIREAARVLELMIQNPELSELAGEDEWIRLKTLAGRLSRPTRNQQRISARKVYRHRKNLRERRDRAVRAESQIRQARAQRIYKAPPRLASKDQPPYRLLLKPKHCYVCKRSFDRLHFFYDLMCPECAEFNYEKRFQTADLSGWTALITGARLKIGYRAALMMLRAGADVVVTTRFPQDAAERYAKEEDYGGWSQRLQIHGLDLRHAPSVEIFTRYLDSSLGRLDIIINNAAQTVRRPPGFYAHLLDHEAKPVNSLSPAAARLLSAREDCRRALGGTPSLPSAQDISANKGLMAWQSGRAGIGITAAAHLSQIRYSYDDAALGAEVFPVDKLDADLQQVDERRHNTWRMTLDEVPTPELVETTFINAISPFILNGKLRPLMNRHKTQAKHIINVSAMEGSFSRKTKTDKHPHTNMAKAALNMMTLTSAPDYKKDGIHMNAVDTGWVTDEDPLHHARRKQAVHDFEPPLDIVDGAARVMDPVFDGLNTGEHVWGKFLKDFKPTDW